MRILLIEDDKKLSASLSKSLRAEGFMVDVARDGISNGVNISSALELQNDSELRVVASGGVASLADVQAARAAGLAGVIIGRALYEGKISLKECFTGAA